MGDRKPKSNLRNSVKAESKNNRDYKLRTRNPLKRFTVKRVI